MALAILCRALGEEDNSQSLAWMLPELQQASPRYAAFSADYLRTLGSGNGLSGALDASVPEGWLSKAAFRLSTVDLESAMEMWQQIKKPALRAETITAITDQVLDPPSSSRGSGAKPVDKALAARLDALVEEAMKAEIAAWKPSKRNDSDVPERVRLALWRAKRGRKAPALQSLKSAEGRLGKLPATAFRDTWTIARAYRDLEAPQAAAWLDKSIAAAIERDSGTVKPDGDGMYIAASTLVARELVRLQRLDEALGLAKRLEESGLDSNASIVTGFVVGALGRSGSPEHLERLRKMLPGLEGAPRTLALSALAEDKARTDLAGAFKMLGELDGDARIRATLRLASKTPDLNAPLVRDVVQQLVAAHLNAWHTARNYSTQESVLGLLDRLSASQMASLAPAFEGEPSEFAWQMLQAVARDKGLSDDPLWQRMRDAKPFGSIPWAPTMLVDAQKSEDEQPRFLPAPPLLSQP
jgi:hypothetical protein